MDDREDFLDGEIKSDGLSQIAKSELSAALERIGKLGEVLLVEPVLRRDAHAKRLVKSERDVSGFAEHTGNRGKTHRERRGSVVENTLESHLEGVAISHSRVQLDLQDVLVLLDRRLTDVLAFPFDRNHLHVLGNADEDAVDFLAQDLELDGCVES